MTLLITIFAAIISTVVWYLSALSNNKLLGTLSLMYWGASLMWLIDAVFEYIELGAEYFTPSVKDMVNDGYLGMSVVALGLVIWIVLLFVKDPENIVKHRLARK